MGQLGPMPDGATVTRPKKTVVEQSVPETAEPPRFQVILHNDDYTPMEFVVTVMKQVFHLSSLKALYVTLTAHRRGRSRIGTYPHDIAETKVAQAVRLAQERGYPLLLTTEPE